MELRDLLDGELSPAVRNYSTAEYNDLLDRLVTLAALTNEERVKELQKALGRALDMAEGGELREVSKLIYWQLVQVGSVALGDMERLMKALNLPKRRAPFIGELQPDAD